MAKYLKAPHPQQPLLLPLLNPNHLNELNEHAFRIEASAEQ